MRTSISLYAYNSSPAITGRGEYNGETNSSIGVQGCDCSATSFSYYQKEQVGFTEQLKLQNVYIMSLQAGWELNDFHNLADTNTVIQKTIGGDRSNSSKRFPILKVADRTTETANPGSSLHARLKGYSKGILTDAVNSDKLKECDLPTINHFKGVNSNIGRCAGDYLPAERALLSYENSTPGLQFFRWFLNPEYIYV